MKRISIVNATPRAKQATIIPYIQAVFTDIFPVGKGLWGAFIASSYLSAISLKIIACDDTNIAAITTNIMGSGSNEITSSGIDNTTPKAAANPATIPLNNLRIVMYERKISFLVNWLEAIPERSWKLVLKLAHKRSLIY